LTTLATRKQSQIFPQHITPETPWQHVCVSSFLKNSSVLNYFESLQHFVQTMAKKMEKKQMISRNMFSIKNHRQVIPMSRNPGDKKRKKKNVFFSFPMFVFFSVLFMFCSFFHVFSFLFVFFIF